MIVGDRGFWGWGPAEQFPDRLGRERVAVMVDAVLGFGKRPLLDPVAAETRALPKSRLVPDAMLSGFATSDDAHRRAHSYGKSYPDMVRGFYGEYQAPPDLVVYPETEAQITAALAWAERHGVAVVPFGGGTSVTGGVNCDVGPGYNGVLSLDLRRLDRVLELDDVSRLARVQAGTTTPVLNAQLASSGFQLRHYPQSYEFATLGGYIATRSGGHYATVYTHIDDFVAGARLIAPAGTYQSWALPGSGAGPSPDRLLIGSEGILGVISEAWIRLQRRPRYRAAATVHFAEFAAAVDATRAVAQSGLNPANCRLLDAREAALNQVTFDGSHVLILGFESSDYALEAPMEAALSLACKHAGKLAKPAKFRDDGESGQTGDTAGAWRQAFLHAPYLRNVLLSLGIIADTFETACSWSRFPALHEALVGEVRDVMKRTCGKGRVSCRFTHVYPDGPAPYYTFLAPAQPGRELEQWAAIKSVCDDVLFRHGATITHHHSVGRMHRRAYDRQRPELFADALAAVKRAWDPRQIMNPGVLIDAALDGVPSRGEQ